MEPLKFEGQLDRLRADIIREEVRKVTGRTISAHSSHAIAKALREADAEAGLYDPLTGRRT